MMTVRFLFLTASAVSYPEKKANPYPAIPGKERKSDYSTHSEFGD